MGIWLILLYTETKKLEQTGRLWNFKKKIALTWARQFKDICFISPHLQTSEEKNQSTEEICTAGLWIFQITSFKLYL